MYRHLKLVNSCFFFNRLIWWLADQKVTSSHASSAKLARSGLWAKQLTFNYPVVSSQFEFVLDKSISQMSKCSGLDFISRCMFYWSVYWNWKPLFLLLIIRILIHISYSGIFHCLCINKYDIKHQQKYIKKTQSTNETKYYILSFIYWVG